MFDKEAADKRADEFKQALTTDMSFEQFAKLWKDAYMVAGHRRLTDATVEFWRERGFAGWGSGTRPSATPAPASSIDSLLSPSA